MTQREMLKSSSLYDDYSVVSAAAGAWKCVRCQGHCASPIEHERVCPSPRLVVPIRPCPNCTTQPVDPESPYGTCSDCWADHDAEVR